MFLTYHVFHHPHLLFYCFIYSFFPRLIVYQSEMQWRQRYNINMNARGWLLNVAMSFANNNKLSSIICWYICNCLSYVTIVVVSIISCLCDCIIVYIIVISANDSTALIPLLLCDVYLVVALYINHRWCKHHWLSVKPLSTTTTITLQYVSNFANNIVVMTLTSSDLCFIILHGKLWYGDNKVIHADMDRIKVELMAKKKFDKWINWRC